MTMPNMNERSTAVLVHPTTCMPQIVLLNTSQMAKMIDNAETVNPSLTVIRSGLSEAPRTVCNPRAKSFLYEYDVFPFVRELCSTGNSDRLNPTQRVRIVKVLVLSPRANTESTTFRL